jgi:alkanesulfonate monooxygenase SsuD/methylene tetrahydromethanopterin reductase-like flavin-dependent oxidoreductase (luciferase family)
MRNVLLVVAAVAFFAWHGGWLSGPVDESVLVGSGPDECAQAERCLAVYLAPWCPECRRSGELVNELRARAALSPSVGFKVIVGRDDEDALAKYASRVGGAVYYDYDGDFWSQLGADGVPAWVTWDAEGRVLEKIYGRPVGAPAHVLVNQMSEELDLEGLL